jgi:hypothetical protein
VRNFELARRVWLKLITFHSHFLAFLM